MSTLSLLVVILVATVAVAVTAYSVGYTDGRTFEICKQAALLAACRAALPFLAHHDALTRGNDGEDNIEAYDRVAAAIEKAESQ